MSGFDSLLIPAVLFFALGVFAQLIKSDLKFPEGMGKGISLYLLMAIGLKGGAELAKADFYPLVYHKILGYYDEVLSQMHLV